MRRIRPASLVARFPALIAGPRHLPRSLHRLFPTTHHVDLVVEAPLEAVREVLGAWGTASAQGPRTSRIEMDVDTLSWPVMFLAALNPKVHPAELRDLLRQPAAHVEAAT